MNSQYRLASTMAYLFLLSMLPIVGCGLDTGESHSIDLSSSLNHSYLKEGEKLLFNCSGVLKKTDKSSTVKQSFILQLIDNDGVVVNQSKRIFHSEHASEVATWISADVFHDLFAIKRTYSCDWMSSASGSILKKTSTVVFANPPVSPVNISYLFISKKLFLYADIQYSKDIQSQLGVGYSLRMRGKDCISGSPKRRWLTIDTCMTKELHGRPVLLCSIDAFLGFCFPLDVVVVTKMADTGSVRSSALQILEEQANENVLSIKPLYTASNQIALLLDHNKRLQYFGNLQYRIKYWQNDKKKREIGSLSNTIKLRHLQPFKCYNVSAKIDISAPFTNEITSFNWTTPKEICTAVKEITQPPLNFKCVEVRTTNRDDSAIKLFWRRPKLNSALFGRISSYRLEININTQFLNQSSNKTIPTPDDSMKEYVTYDYNTWYTYGSFVEFKLTACNAFGCSQNYSKCTLVFKEHQPDEEQSTLNLSLLLSCLVPIGVIIFLIIAAFCSYYRKKEILTELNGPLNCSGKTNHGVERSSSSYSDDVFCGAKEQRKSKAKSFDSSDKLLQRTLTERTKYIDQQVISADNEYAKMVVHTIKE